MPSSAAVPPAHRDRSHDADRVEVAIVGGGPAGLSAALVLARCRRRVVVFDSGSYRNASSPAVRGFLTQDGISPEDFRRAARAQIARYETVELRRATVVDVVRENDDAFVVRCDVGPPLRCRKLLLATGLVDQLPPIAGAERLFGAGLYSCPYCDGWELRDQPLASYDRQGRFSIALSQWTRDVVILSDGSAEIDAETERRIGQLGLRVDPRRIRRFEREGGNMLVIFEDGAALRRRAVFVNGGCRQRSGFAERLGCAMDERGGVRADRHESTSVPGVYVAGDASRDALLAIVAAGEGAGAAMAINSALSAASGRS